MYDPELGLARSRAREAQWDHYQEVEERLGSDDSYVHWLKVVYETLDIMDDIRNDLMCCFDIDEENRLRCKFKELSEAVGTMIEAEKRRRPS